MPTSNERASALLAKLRQAELPAPLDSVELSQISTRAMLRDAGHAVELPEPQLNVRLHGQSVPGHDIAVREAASILGSLQEAVSACGQAVANKATKAGSVQAAILRATELRFSPALGFGSVVFHLGGAGEVLTGEEFPEATGSETLLDWVFRDLFKILHTVASDDLSEKSAVEDLRRLGPRTIKHLNDLVKHVVDSDIDIDFSWKNGAVKSEASLKRRGALALKDAIQRTREEITDQSFRGTLSTVSTVVNPQLLTEEGRRIDISVDPIAAAGLGAFYNRRVEVKVEQKRIWSISSGKETLRYRLLSISYLDDEMDIQ